MGKTKAGKTKGKKAKSGHKTMAQRADRHVLYEQSVQDPPTEYKFVQKTFFKLRGRKPTVLREDFCGTANMASYWVSRDPNNRAFGVDLDADVLAWGREHHLAQLSDEQRSRITLQNDNVLTAETPPVDVVLAYNFSYYILQQRSTMRDYFSRIYSTLADDGVFFLDAFGGYEAFQELEESSKYKGFTYIWDQAWYNPITGEMACNIHFKFPDKSELRPAFSYTWRMWTLPEIQEILAEAGFKNILIYWEGTDKEGDGNGVFKPSRKADADAGWVCYITAEK